MRYCKECRLKLRDDEEYCRRCGSTNIGYIPDDEYEKRKQQKQQKPSQSFETNTKQESISRDFFDSDPKQGHQKSRVSNSEPKVENSNINIYGENSNSEEIVTFKEWVINILLLMIPIYGIIRLIQIVVGGRKFKRSMVNCYRATVLVSFVSSIIFSVFVKVIFTMLQNGAIN